ncbi:MAG: hypothetical protein IKC47_03590 [Clostridia bacterium]|nr:hypothetical protein [Clostridia bacterium]
MYCIKCGKPLQNKSVLCNQCKGIEPAPAPVSKVIKVHIQQTAPQVTSKYGVWSFVISVVSSVAAFVATLCALWDQSITCFVVPFLVVAEAVSVMLAVKAISVFRYAVRTGGKKPVAGLVTAIVALANQIEAFSIVGACIALALA